MILLCGSTLSSSLAKILPDERILFERLHLAANSVERVRRREKLI